MRAAASGRGVGRDEGEESVSCRDDQGARTCTEGSCVRIRDDIPDANTRFVGGGGIATRRPTRRPRVVPHCLDSSANPNVNSASETRHRRRETRATGEANPFELSPRTA